MSFRGSGSLSPCDNKPDHPFTRDPGVRLHYEVRGDGPSPASGRYPHLLLLLGAPMPAADFAPLAEALASDHTVVTTDPRGIANSALDDPQQDSTPELRADDVAAILDDLGAVSADVFGSSGGAVTGLALVSRYPTRPRSAPKPKRSSTPSTVTGCRLRWQSLWPTPDST